MSELYEKSLLKLELDQVLELLSQCAGSQGGKDACLRLRPNSDLEEVELLLLQTTAASDLCTRKGNPVFGDVNDTAASLERADRGGSLQPIELLRIAGVLRCARTIKSYVSEDDKQSVLDPLFKALTTNKYLEDKIFGAILSEEEIADNASTELSDIRRHMRSSRRRRWQRPPQARLTRFGWSPRLLPVSLSVSDRNILRFRRCRVSPQ